MRVILAGLTALVLAGAARAQPPLRIPSIAGNWSGYWVRTTIFGTVASYGTLQVRFGHVRYAPPLPNTLYTIGVGQGGYCAWPGTSQGFWGPINGSEITLRSSAFSGFSGVTYYDGDISPDYSVMSGTWETGDSALCSGAFGYWILFRH